MPLQQKNKNFTKIVGDTMKMEEIIKNPLFYHIQKEDLEAMMKCVNAREESFRKGEFIISSDDTLQLIGLVLEGSVEMINEDEFGKKSILTIMYTDGLFGETFACAQAKHRIVAFQAHEDCRVLLMDYERILNSCKVTCIFHHRLIENMVMMIAAKNLELMEKAEIISRPNMREKILAYLQKLAQTNASKTFTVPFNRTEMAEYLCADRSAMTRELSRMQEEGILAFQKREFTLYTKK